MQYRLLLVDNTTAIMNPWKQGLASRYATAEAFGGIEALRKLKTEHFDAVIVNISLRQLNGVDAIAKIRSSFDKIPIIVLFDKKDILDLKQARAYSIDALISLPVDYKKLIEEIQAVLPPQGAPAPVKPAPQRSQEPVARTAERPSETAVPKKQPPPGAWTDPGDIDVEKYYYEGLSAISGSDIPGAIRIFESLVTVTRIKRESWRRLIEESLFQLGQCYAALKKYEKSNSYYAAFITKAPHNSSFRSALLYMGKNHLALKNKEKAALYFNKVIKTASADSFTTQARKLLKTIE